MPSLHRPASSRPCPYAVDLLKGEGLPIRSRPGGIAFASLIIVLPLLTAFGMVSFYLDGDVIIAIQRQQLSRLDAAIEALAGAVQKKEALEKEKAETTRVLADVQTTLGRHHQWSGTLAALAARLSDNLVLTKLEARQEMTRTRVPAKDDPAKKVEVSVPVRTLRICVCGKEKESSAEAVRQFQESLRSSPALGPMVDTITVSQDAATLEGRAAVLYELSCVFKPTVQ